MLLSQESVLRRLPTNVDSRAVLFLDGIRYSIEIIDLAYRRLCDELEHIAREGNTSGQLSQRTVQATADAWTIIDATHRLRELVQQLPGLRQREPAVQLFLRGTATAKALRNFVQHFRTGIDVAANRRLPVWGTRSWISTCRETGFPTNHIIGPGTFKEHTLVGCVFDTWTGKFVDRIVLHADDTRVDLAVLFDGVAAFVTWFESWAAARHTGVDRFGSDVHYSFTISPCVGQCDAAELPDASHAPPLAR